MKKYVIFISLIFSANLSFAQENRVSRDEDLQSIFIDTWGKDIFDETITANTDPGFGGNEGNNTTDVPIDGGLGFLLAAGVGYAVNGMRRKRKKGKNHAEDQESTI